jgi:hypothetical protein
VKRAADSVTVSQVQFLKSQIPIKQPVQLTMALTLENFCQRKMALDILSFDVKKKSVFYTKMNEMLRLPCDTSLDDSKLCAGSRETMRYLVQAYLCVCVRACVLANCATHEM